MVDTMDSMMMPNGAPAAMQRTHQTGDNTASNAAIRVEDRVTAQLGLTTNHSKDNVTQVVELPRRMIAKTKTDKTNPIAVNNVYDFVGSNGIF
jgi:hypothetical protein